MRAKAHVLIVCIIAVVLAGSLQSMATPVQYGNNYYEFVPSPSVTDPFISWADAQAAANSSTFNSLTGHLATITSAGENAFLLSLVPANTYTSFAGAWLGGYNGLTTGSVVWSEGTLADASSTYTNFGGMEPNNGPSYYLYMNIGTLFAGIDPGKWVDDSGVNGQADSSDPVKGYFVEYEGSVNAVPEPSTLMLLGSGLIGAFALKRKYHN